MIHAKNHDAGEWCFCKTKYRRNACGACRCLLFDAMLYSVLFLPEAVLRLLQAIFVDYIWSIAILFVAVVCFLFGLLGMLLLDENPISLRIMKLDVI